MRLGESVAYRIRRPTLNDSGFRPAVVLSKNNHGYTLCVFINPDLDTDVQSADLWTGIFYARNTKAGDEVNEFQDLDAIHGLDGEAPYAWSNPSLTGLHATTKPMKKTPEPEIDFDAEIKKAGG